MSNLVLQTNPGFTLEIIARKSDKYSNSGFIKIVRNSETGTHNCNEFFMTPDEMELFGKYLCRQAAEIRSDSSLRNK